MKRYTYIVSGAGWALIFTSLAMMYPEAFIRGLVTGAVNSLPGGPLLTFAYTVMEALGHAPRLY